MRNQITDEIRKRFWRELTIIALTVIVMVGFFTIVAGIMDGVKA